ncbi:MAG: aldose epimerase family protein [Fimbriimonas sp.]
MIEKTPFGTTANGEAVDLYTITNTRASRVKIITYGAIVTELWVPDRRRNHGDVVLGFDTLAPYETESPYFGAIIGRVGNRIANGKFTLDGTEYSLPINNGPNSLHGGLTGYDKRIWRAEALGTGSVRLTLQDPDGAEGYPGNVNVEIVYTLTNDDVLRIEYTATTDKPTPINLTNHTYFNLKDAGRNDALGHVVQIEADEYTPVDETLIPTGEIASVAGTPIDFTSPKPLGQDLAAMGGYDHNLVLRGKDGSLARAATIAEPETGRRIEVWTTEPGMQFYSGNFLDGAVRGKRGTVYGRHHAFCLETQHYPDSVNHENFPSTILRPGETYRTTTEYRFSAE